MTRFPPIATQQEIDANRRLHPGWWAAVGLVLAAPFYGLAGYGFGHLVGWW